MLDRVHPACANPELSSIAIRTTGLHFVRDGYVDSKGPWLAAMGARNHHVLCGQVCVSTMVPSPGDDTRTVDCSCLVELRVLLGLPEGWEIF